MKVICLKSVLPFQQGRLGWGREESLCSQAIVMSPQGGGAAISPISVPLLNPSFGMSPSAFGNV